MGNVQLKLSVAFCWLLVILSIPALVSSLTEVIFKIATGFNLSQGTPLRKVYSDSISLIFCSIMCSTECGSASYSLKYKTCITFVERFYNSSILWSPDPDWEVLYRDEPIQHENWTMVFRAQREINIPMYDIWNATGEHDDRPLSSGSLNGCYRVDNLGGCKQHFRSSILDHWVAITQVKFSVYVNGSEVNHVVFNGTSTTRDSWYQQSNIMTSSWSGIKTDPAVAYFSTEGYTNKSSIRRFIICGAYGNCSSDSYYFLAVDKAYDRCAPKWFLNFTSYPVFMSSTRDGMAVISRSPREFLYADVLAIFVKF